MTLRKTAGYLWNPISLIGFLLAVVATGLIIAFIAMEMITGIDHPYIGLLVYFAFPGMLILGLILVPIGAWRVRNQRRTEVPEEVPPYPRVDFNDPHKRRLFIFFVLASVIFVLIVSVASILGFEFTESTTFCGELCHVVMEPEHKAWQGSPHARVKCVECHVGPGAEWYVKAKLSGLRQVWAVLTHSYHFPIATPIENLRPARDTCEQCHWPEKFYSGRQRVFYHYAPNKENTPREINMLIKIGGTPKSPHAMGIHWHIGTEVTYIARDRKRLDIPYVAVKQKDGSIVEYMDTEKPLTREEIAKAEKRRMDCIDCHNRPTHIYRSPAREMDEHIVSGQIDAGLPYIKKVAVEILEQPYKSKEEAHAAIEAKLPEYYAKNFPEVAKAKAAAINQAVAHVKDIYARNFFPRMDVTWSTYPNHIGHFYTPGCFRCHDGKHKTSTGKIISKDCAMCHEMISQKGENIPEGKVVKEFVHPADIGDALYKVNCSDCHMAAAEDSAGGEGHGKH
ncbi:MULTISPECIES: cytochrome c3 family protein [Geobacter]|uniref:cytochrome c3 family protein n=1 Tax=Geobacter TaxID=28231 RepID=UPI00257449E3|nr:NapC/NirT family cytochrome c [Geobacter sulfurreducens]BEH11769.1 NapC/NirT family cytochrome c [Geobacter sulfurreducens subsp. ethanolicus]BET59629.1 NapC/NirT family cytochrome c [Geobacter sp. 60473]HML77066.1 NapC/NirT family cytochrome c [Geobacter sulfurreducens]